jgi:hypothetical protein
MVVSWLDECGEWKSKIQWKFVFAGVRDVQRRDGLATVDAADGVALRRIGVAVTWGV